MKIRIFVLLALFAVSLPQCFSGSPVRAQESASKKQLLTCPFCGEKFSSLKEHVYAIDTKSHGDFWTCDNSLLKSQGKLVPTDEPCDVCPPEPEDKEEIDEGKAGVIELGSGGTHVVPRAPDSTLGETTYTVAGVPGSGAVLSVDSVGTSETMTWATPTKVICPYCGLSDFPHLMQVPIGQDANGTTTYWETCSVEFGRVISRMTAGKAMTLPSTSITLSR